MSSGPIQYDFPSQLATMASIPAQQAQAGLTQAQTAQIRAATNYNLWKQSYLQNLQTTPDGSNSTGMVEPTLAGPPPSATASAPAPAAGTPSTTPTPNALVSNVPYVNGNASAMPAGSGAPSTATALAPASSGSAPSPAGSTTSTQPAVYSTGNPDDGTGGKFDEPKLYNDIHKEYAYKDYDPKVEAAYAINGMDPGTMYRPQVDAQNLALAQRARSDIQKLQSVATAPNGSMFAVYDQVYGTAANPHPSTALEAQGVTESQLASQLSKTAHMVTMSARLPAEAQDNGDTITYVDPVTKVPMFGMGTVTKVPNPEAALTAATTQRGQNITAATAARGQNLGALEIQKDAAGLPFIVDKRTGALFAGSPANRLLGPGAGTGAAPPASSPTSAAAPPPSAAVTATTIAPKMLPGVDLTQLPQAQAPPGGFQNEIQKADAMAANTRKNNMIASASADVQKSAADNALLAQEQSKLNSINPRAVGPGSAAYKAMMELQTAASGKAPNDLVDMGIVGKLSSQLGMQNAQQLLKGMRITNNEMMTVLNLASANPNQPLAVMRGIIALQRANNEYTGLAGQTTVRGIKSGADADQVAAGIEAQSPRSSYVANRITEMTAPAPPQSLAALLKNPTLASQFKARYGYLPTGNQ